MLRGSSARLEKEGSGNAFGFTTKVVVCTHRRIIGDRSHCDRRARRRWQEPNADRAQRLDAESLFTVGDSVGGYTPVGVLDGLAAWDVGGGIVKVFSNHELAFNAGASYQLANRTSLQGARVSFFNIDVATRTVVSAGLAYDTVYDRLGNVVTSPGQINERASHTTGGLDRLCSSHGYSAGDYGLVDDIYFTSEESSTGFGHPHGGSFWALDVANGDLYALPDLGRGSVGEPDRTRHRQRQPGCLHHG